MSPSSILRALPPADAEAGGVPAVAVEPTARVIALGELPELPPTADVRALDETMHPLHQVQVGLQVCVGEVSVTVGQLLSARQHQVFALDRTIEQPVDLLLDGRVVARGQLIAVDERFAVRITELPVPLRT